MKYSFFLLFSLWACSPSKLDNACDLESPSFLNTMIVKTLIGDTSAHCGVRIPSREVNICSLDRSSILQPEYSQKILEELSLQANKGSFASPSVDSSSITVPIGSFRWNGGVLAPNGKIYGNPTRRLVFSLSILS